MSFEGVRAWLHGNAEPRVRQDFVRCADAAGLHRMAYLEWGERNNPRVLVCVHGLTRNARDFDELARDLGRDFRVICPDVVGRGRSDRLTNKSGYTLAQYVADMMVLLARLEVETVGWIGTSMGGLIGMQLAAQVDSPISRLVLNDVGPVITAVSLKRIAEYVGRAPVFPDFKAAERYIRYVGAQFGPLSDGQWRHMTETSVREREDGSYELIYDPAIGDAFRVTPLETDVELWPLYDAIRCPTLALRGAESDLLTESVHAEMGMRGPHARLIEIPGVGHAPMLMDEPQRRLIREFLMEQGG